MNPSLILGLLAVSLVVMGGVRAIRVGEVPAGSGENSRTVEPTRSARSGYPAESSFRYVSGFQQLDYNGAPTFAQLEARISQLSDDQLFQLLNQIDPSANFATWVRSAIWAEFGRRNHKEAFSLLIAQAGDKEWPGDALAQSVFAFFRGRAESLDSFEEMSDGLLGQIKRFEEQAGGSGWQPVTVARVFQRMAVLDAEKCWQLANESRLAPGANVLFDGNVDSYYRIVGFFRGLNLEEDVRHYLARWQPVVESAEYRKVYEEFLTPSVSLHRSFRSFKLRPLNESLIAQLLSALARHDAAAAAEWLQSHQHKVDQPDHRRTAEVWETFAKEYPGDAMTQLSNPDLSAYHFKIAAEIGKHNFSLAPDLVLTPGLGIETQAHLLNRLIDTSAMENTIDRFPVPEKHNQIPNYQERYDQLLEAIDRSEVAPEAKQGLREKLDRNFSQHLNVNR